MRGALMVLALLAGFAVLPIAMSAVWWSMGCEFSRRADWQLYTVDCRP